jgi:hypothetical protein
MAQRNHVGFIILLLLVMMLMRWRADSILMSIIIVSFGESTIVVHVGTINGSRDVGSRWQPPTQDLSEGPLELPGRTSVDYGIKTGVEIAEPEEQVEHPLGNVTAFAKSS